MGVYVHLPVCRRKCHYCSFVSRPLAGFDQPAYFRALARDLAAWQAAVAGGTAALAGGLNSIYWGGGTPSLVSAGAIVGLTGRIRRDLPVSPEPEITVEVNPESLTADWLGRLLDAEAVNRLSIGVQCFDDRVLARAGRLHDRRQAVAAVMIARRLGLMNISIDLLAGLPGQTPAGWQDDVRRAVDLGVPHISVYCLKIDPGSRWYGQGVTGDEDQAAGMWQWACDWLPQQGFERYEMSSFAWPGHRSRHNLNYWRFGEYLGLGVAACSFVGGVRYENTADYEAYLLPSPDRRQAVECRPEDLQFEFIFLRLRTGEGLDRNEYRQYWRQPLPPGVEAALEWAVEQGLAGVGQADGSWRLTGKGFMFSNQVFSRILRQME
ncbi:MAG: radical SAM family heme chaperone HemW [Negativicutes bacterium]|nr:radical SAM family heme chaperone HemW [Negativicutes bacterium]